MERSEAYWVLHNMWNDATEEQREALSIAQRDIEFVDLMDDRFLPVKHGRWERSEWGYPDRTVTCSCCGFTFDSTDYTTPKFQQKAISYCPNCGAKMDLEEYNG